MTYHQPKILWKYRWKFPQRTQMQTIQLLITKYDTLCATTFIVLKLDDISMHLNINLYSNIRASHPFRHSRKIPLTHWCLIRWISHWSWFSWSVSQIVIVDSANGLEPNRAKAITLTSVVMIMAVIAFAKSMHWSELQDRFIMQSEAPVCVLVHAILNRHFNPKHPDQFPFLKNSWKILFYYNRVVNDMILLSKFVTLFCIWTCFILVVTA